MNIEELRKEIKILVNNINYNIPDAEQYDKKMQNVL